MVHLVYRYPTARCSQGLECSGRGCQRDSDAQISKAGSQLEAADGLFGEPVGGILSQRDHREHVKQFR